MAADNGAVGDRGLRLGNSRTNCVTRGAWEVGQSVAPRKLKLIAVVIVVLLVGVFAVVLVQGHMPSTTRSSRPYTLDHLLWTAEGDQYEASFGYSVSSAGDVNNDGYDDIVVGANRYANGETYEGRAFLYLGTSTGPSGTPSWTAEGDQIGANFGCSVSSAGDVNNDGYDDVVVGARFYVNGESYEGRAYLYLGSSAGLSATPSWIAEGDQTWAWFGCSVSSAGDVNNDGYDDVVVGAQSYSNDEPYEGRAFLYLGSSAGLSTTPSWTAESDQTSSQFGYSVSSAGDVNNDGYDDVVVGAYLYGNPEMQEGRAFLYLGSSTGPSGTPSWTAESDQAGAGFGWSVSSAGDVNNDGYEDVVVGAHYYANGEFNEGRAFLYLGSSSGLSATPSWTAEGDLVEARFGRSVSSAGDVNNDGYHDVVIGAPRNDTLKGGCAYLYLGSSAGLSASPSWTSESDQVGSFFGESVSSAGDVNGDGFDEVIVGASSYDNDQIGEGRAYVYGEVLIPEFDILLIPIVGAVAIVVAMRHLRTTVKK